MPKRTRKRSRPKPAPVVVLEQDQTVLDLDELAVLWPRLEYAVARDTAGPSAEHGRSGTRSADGWSSKVAAADNAADFAAIVKAAKRQVINVDVERARAEITTGVDRIAAEAEALLNLDRHWRPSVRRYLVAIAALGRAGDDVDVAQAEVERLVRNGMLTKVNHIMRARAQLDEAVRVLRRREAVVRQAKRNVRINWTSDVLVALPDWYVQLRNRNQPLAGHIRADAKTWLRQARTVLRLRTHEAGIGRLCPDHRDRPTELRREADEATLPVAVLAGRRQPIDKASGLPIDAALTWERSDAVYCPTCKRRWSGITELRVLMLMIETADKVDSEAKQ